MKILPITFLIYFFFIYQGIPGQQNVADSLEKQINNLSGTKKVDLLNQLSDIYQYINTKRAIDYAYEGIELAKQINYKKGLAAAYGNVGYSYVGLNNQKAIENTKIALQMRKEIGDKIGTASSLNVLGIINYYQGDYLIAVEYHLQALKLREEFGDKTKIATSYNNIALVHMALKNYDVALDYLNKALQVRIETGSKSGIGITKDNIGDVYRMMKKYDKAMEYFNEALRINHEIGNTKSEANSLFNIGRVYHELKDYPNALSYYSRALAFYKLQAQPKGIANVETGIATTYKEKGDLKAAIKHAEIAIENAQQIKSLDNISIAANILQSSYQQLGNYKKAFTYLTMLKAADDSLKNDEKMKRLNKLELDNKIERMERLQEIELDKQKFFNQILSVVLFFLGVIAVLIYWGYRQKKKTNIQLNELNSKLQQLNSTKDKFFSIIAHDLKNPFNSIINSSKLIVSDFESFEKKELLQFLEIILKSSEAAHNLLENLLLWARSQTGRIKLEKKTFDISSSIYECLDLLSQQSVSKNIKINSTIKENTPVFADQYTTITVIRNLLSNAIKFTNPGGIIEINSRDREKEIIIEIKDSGMGIRKEDLEKLFRIEVSTNRKGTAGETGTGLGLILCKDFIESNGGKIWVESEFMKGSTFCFTLPKEQSN
ncbi:MAG: tetratricopeptide repeat-containing sensor histidine kinase [Ignavibacteriales bacterium]|nr:tetratricopeptide repeat-containing sensor histidine kinase [Ignavibacteriales bacterium]